MQTNGAQGAAECRPAAKSGTRVGKLTQEIIQATGGRYVPPLKREIVRTPRGVLLSRDGRRGLQVFDQGDALLLDRRGRIANVPLGEIVHVGTRCSMRGRSRWRTVTVSCDSVIGPNWGKKVTFLAGKRDLDADEAFQSLLARIRRATGGSVTVEPLTSLEYIVGAVKSSFEGGARLAMARVVSTHRPSQ